jgi:predicted HD phosphohydrolase
VSAGFTDVAALFDALAASRDADDEGGLSILEHSLQCADVLLASHPDDVELQVAGLVHDLGWLERTASGWTLRMEAAHDVDGRALVHDLLGDRIATLVGGHVAAKRYLLATDPGYAALLSARSEVTLQFQGGVMGADEIAAFEQRPERDDLVALRRADDAAKVRGRAVPGLDAWLPRVTSMCRTRGT